MVCDADDQPEVSAPAGIAAHVFSGASDGSFEAAGRNGGSAVSTDALADAADMACGTRASSFRRRAAGWATPDASGRWMLTVCTGFGSNDGAEPLVAAAWSF